MFRLNNLWLKCGIEIDFSKPFATGVSVYCKDLKLLRYISRLILYAWRDIINIIVDQKGSIKRNLNLLVRLKSFNRLVFYGGVKIVKIQFLSIKLCRHQNPLRVRTSPINPKIPRILRRGTKII